MDNWYINLLWRLDVLKIIDWWFCSDNFCRTDASYLILTGIPPSPLRQTWLPMGVDGSVLNIKGLRSYHWCCILGNILWGIDKRRSVCVCGGGGLYDLAGIYISLLLLMVMMTYIVVLDMVSYGLVLVLGFWYYIIWCRFKSPLSHKKPQGLKWLTTQPIQ